MIEMAILAMVFAVVAKRGAEDLIHTARGGTPPRLAAAKARRKSGAASRYFGQLWDDTWDDLAKRHAEKRDRRNAAPRPVRDPGQWRTVFTQFGDDFGNWARATWRYGWNRHAARRQEKRLRDSAGRQTVPGTVVPNAQDEDGDRPQDRPVPEARLVPDGDGGTDLRFGEDEDDPTGVSSCPECQGTVLVDGEVCLSCRDRQEQRNQHHEDQVRPDSGPDNRYGVVIPPPAFQWKCPKCKKPLVPDQDSMHFDEGDGGAMIDARCPDCRMECPYYWHPTDEEYEDFFGHSLNDDEDQDDAPQPPPVYNGWDHDPSPATPTTTEGPITMSTITGEIGGLEAALQFSDQVEQQYRAQVTSCEAVGATCTQYSKAYREQSVAIEAARASITAGGVTGVAVARFTNAMDMSISAAADMEAAAKLVASAQEKSGAAATDFEASAAEFRQHLGIKDGYSATPGAGDRDFIMAG